MRRYLSFIRDKLVSKLYQWLLAAEKREIARKNNEWISKLKTCGQGLRANGSIYMSGAAYAELGSNIHIGDNAFIRAEGGLKIGNNTHISRNLVLYTINHSYEGERLPYDDTVVRKSVEIGRNVWIGMNVCIAPGSKIGDGAIIGMGTVVSGEVPALSIIGSQKFRVLKYRDETHYHKLEAAKVYGGVNGRALDK